MSLTSRRATRSLLLLFAAALLWAVFAPADLAQLWRHEDELPNYAQAKSRTRHTNPEWNHPLPASLPETSFNLSLPRPAWLSQRLDDVPDAKPLSLRIAIFSHPHEFERRSLMRQAMLADICEREVRFEYRFLVGHAGDGDERSGDERAGSEDAFWAAIDRRVRVERTRFADVEIFPIHEGVATMGEKRFMALQWGTALNDFDYLVVSDTDTFIRVTAFARWLHTLHSARHQDPADSVFLAHTQTGSVHWSPPLEAVDEEVDIWDDVAYEGLAYRYPVGGSYVMSRGLANTLADRQEDLPRNVEPFMDLMLVGSWISDIAPEPETSIHNRPAVFHAPPNHGTATNVEDVIGWESLFIQHLDSAEMRALRSMSQFEDEWETGHI